MSSEWDLPETHCPDARANSVRSEAVRRAPMPLFDMDKQTAGRGSDARGSGMVDPVALFGFIFRNIFKIGVIALALTAAASRSSA